jgi:hypothetical protein
MIGYVLVGRTHVASSSSSISPETSPPGAGTTATTAALPGKVTLHLAVTPPDADVIVEGLRAGKASEPLVLPRSARGCTVRIEKRGFEAQTLYIVPDRDADLPPMVLLAAPPPSSGSSMH